MKTALVLAGSLLLGTLAAQEPAEPATEKTTAEERMAELREVQGEVIKKWREAQKAAKQAAKEGKEEIPAVPTRPDFSKLVSMANGFAAEFAGTDDAVQFLVMTINYSAQSDKQATRKALDTLLASHLHSDSLTQIGRMIPYLGQIVDEQYASKAHKLLSTSKNETVANFATMALHQGAIEGAPFGSKEYEGAKAAMLELAEKVDDERMAQQIRDSISEREKHGVGTPGQEIEGVDLDGVAFKLSDYKGKVIFVDFWGDW